MNEQIPDIIKSALFTAYQLGQTYWSHADSDRASSWKKADLVASDFDKLVEETVDSVTTLLKG